jgi:cytochrome c peroxidase
MRKALAIIFVFFPFPGLGDTLPKADADFPKLNMTEVRLGQLLFYDPILSGNKTVSCATCHHPRFGTSDGLSLGLGDGAIGLGPDRQVDPLNLPEQRIPRNAPALFNLGASEFSVLFHDGRLEADPSEPGGFRTPLGSDMETGFDSVLSAQTMFPVLSPDEMAGHYSENDVAQAVRQGFFTGPNGAWDILTKRVEAIPTYDTGFREVLGSEKQLHFANISNAIAAFMAFEWRADNSPFDQHLKTKASLSADQVAGMELFYGHAGCSECHSGQFQTDHSFHAIGMPQIGPGKAARFERHAKDEGRMRVTGEQKDAYAFRTPSLRNVTHTAPYGHAGTFTTLEDVVKHHSDPRKSLVGYDGRSAILPYLNGADDFTTTKNTQEQNNILAAMNFKAVQLSQSQIDALVAFLGALTDEQAINGRLGIPKSVPSGLPIRR